MRRLFLIIGLVGLASCGSKSPTSPSTTTTTAAPTRVISLGGNMAFGNIQVGSSFQATLTITNSGNAPLTITGMTAPSAGAGVYKSTFTSGTIQPGTTQSVTITFSPPDTQSYNGTLSVSGDFTSGTNTIPISGTGSLNGVAVFSRTGSGDNVFTIPSYVSRIRVDANFSGSCQNFIVHLSTQITSLINIIIGTCSVADTRSPFSGTYAINGGGQISITGSTGINWTFTEVR